MNKNRVNWGSTKNLGYHVDYQFIIPFYNDFCITLHVGPKDSMGYCLKFHYIVTFKSQIASVIPKDVPLVIDEDSSKTCLTQVMFGSPVKIYLKEFHRGVFRITMLEFWRILLVKKQVNEWLMSPLGFNNIFFSFVTSLLLIRPRFDLHCSWDTIMQHAIFLFQSMPIQNIPVHSDQLSLVGETHFEQQWYLMSWLSFGLSIDMYWL